MWIRVLSPMSGLFSAPLVAGGCCCSTSRWLAFGPLRLRGLPAAFIRAGVRGWQWQVVWEEEGVGGVWGGQRWGGELQVTC